MMKKPYIKIHMMKNIYDEKEKDPSHFVSEEK